MEKTAASGRASVLDSTLTLARPGKETIYGVLGRMEVLLDYFKQNERHHGLVPFLEVYYLVTKAVAEKRVLDETFFDDFASVERLDVHFASLYFKPLRRFLAAGRAPRPWQRYFSYCSEDGGIPFLQMLLDINAHINADLCRTLVALRYDQKKDFCKIDRVLEEALSEIIRYLALHEHDVFGWGGLVFRQFFIDELHTVIVRWRADAWKNAHARMRDERPSWSGVHRATEAVGAELACIFDNVSHARHLLSALPEVNALSVKL